VFFFVFVFLCVCVFLRLSRPLRLQELIEDILSCGYNGPVNVEKREEILRYNCFVTMLILVNDVYIHVLIFLHFA